MLMKFGLGDMLSMSPTLFFRSGEIEFSFMSELGFISVRKDDPTRSLLTYIYEGLLPGEVILP